MLLNKILTNISQMSLDSIRPSILLLLLHSGALWVLEPVAGLLQSAVERQTAIYSPTLVSPTDNFELPVCITWQENVAAGQNPHRHDLVAVMRHPRVMFFFVF